MPGFAPIDMTGPIYAFDDAVQVGTWEIVVSEFLPSAVPEPGPLALLGIGFAALAIRRRPRSIIKKLRVPGAGSFASLWIVIVAGFASIAPAGAVVITETLFMIS